jgi:branched-chain amino acid transport system permease protein
MLIQIGLNGLILGGNYALVAVGLTLIFGVMRMVNFAQGQSVMIGAFTAFTVAPLIGYVPGILVAVVGSVAFGVVLERLAFRPFRGAELNGLIASMGMSIILVNLAELVWGTTPRTFETALNQMSLTFGTVGVSAQRLLVVGASLLMLVALWGLVRFSSIGRQFRAVAEDVEIAEAIGIDADRVSRRAVVLGSMLGAAAGALSGPVALISPQMGQTEMLNAFAAIILGGFGNVSGTIFGALMIGLVQATAAVYVSNAYASSIAFAILVVTLIVFPRGIVPEPVAENV